MTFKLTELGKLLEAQLAAGSKPIITRIEGSDAYSSNPEALLAVQNVKQSLQVESVTVVDGKSHLKFILSNIGLDEEYYLKQIGIYAKQTEDSEEILYFIGQDRNGERIPAISEKEVEFEYDLTITVDNAYEVTVAVNGNDFARKDALDELDKKKIDGAGGDISNTVIAATEESKTEYPVPAAGDSAKTVLGKIQKFFADIRNWMTGVCMLGQIVNNCVTDNAKLPLSAAQGKALMDLYNVLNTNEKGRLIYEVADCTTDPHCILPIPQKDGYRAASAISHDPQYATLIYHYGFHAIPVDYITLNRAGAGTTIRVGILYVKIN